MKVDLVVNTMIQQIDRNLQSQLTPALVFRAGEILHGRVMLTSDDKLQIRLDNGALLNAIPSGNVLLSPGAMVTLRVSGQMDGQFVMQLIEQELSGELTASVLAQGGYAEVLNRLGLAVTPQNRQVLEAMEQMHVPIREETVRQALETLAAFPGLEPEKAVFLAANRIAATQANVDALKRLVDGRATTGGELAKLAEILLNQPAEEGIAPSPANLTGRAPVAQAGDQASQAPAAATSAGATLPLTGMPAADAVAQQPGAIPTGWPVAVPDGEPEGGAAPGLAAGAPASAALPRQAAPGDDGMLRMQGLVLVALGMEAAETTSGPVLKLAEAGVLKQTVALALDGPFLQADVFEGRLDALLQSLPPEAAPEARTFLIKLTAGLNRYMQANGPQTLFTPAAEAAPEGVARIVQEIADLFARIDGEGAAGDALAKAAAQQPARLARIAGDVAAAGAAGTDAMQQLTRVDSHVRLLENINQYVYQQIPVQMGDRRCTVELYVLNRGKGGKKINPANANILIALDTDHMGRLETLINVTQKNLRLRFGVESPRLAGYIDSFTADISDAMQAIGYRLSDVRTEVTRKPVTPLTVAEAVEPRAGGQARLDMKL